MLPFIVGLAAGAAVVYTVSNRKEIKESLKGGVDKAKELTTDAKKSIDGTLECLKSKKTPHSDGKEV